MSSETWEIYPRLFQGCIPERDEVFDHDMLILCEPYRPEGIACRGDIHHWPFRDSEEPHEVSLAVSSALELSRRASERWRAGQSIRVSCMAGLNRSGLVVAITLCRLGLSPDAAIDQIRWKRGSMALRNKEYEWWIRNKLEQALLDEAKTPECKI